jgi:hypothetical protein
MKRQKRTNKYKLVKTTRLTNTFYVGGERLEDLEHHLMCYQVKLATVVPAQAKPASVTGIFLGSRFGRERVDALAPGELCVPSTVTLP